MTFRSDGHLYAPMALGIVVAMMISIVWHSLILEYRWSRDLFRLTPFHDVRIERVQVDGPVLTIWGSFKKRRCERLGVTAYTRTGEALTVAGFSANGENAATPQDRPPSPWRQSFGPWAITASSPAPEEALLFAFHKCPEGLQKNLVFEVPWRNAP